MIKKFEQFINESRFEHGVEPFSRFEHDEFKRLITLNGGNQMEAKALFRRVSGYLTYQETMNILHRLYSMENITGEYVIAFAKHLFDDGISVEEKKRELDIISKRFNNGKKIPIGIEESGRPFTSDDIDKQCGWEDDGSFEEFVKKTAKPLRENKHFSYDDYDYTQKLIDLASDCVRDTIDLIEYKGNGRVELKDWLDKFYFYKEDAGHHGNRGMKSGEYKELVAIEIDDDINYAEKFTGERFMYHYDGDFLVAVTDDGERIPVDFFTCPTDTLIGINMAVIENIDW